MIGVSRSTDSDRLFVFIYLPWWQFIPSSQRLRFYLSNTNAKNHILGSFEMPTIWWCIRLTENSCPNWLSNTKSYEGTKYYLWLCQCKDMCKNLKVGDTFTTSSTCVIPDWSRHSAQSIRDSKVSKPISSNQWHHTVANPFLRVSCVLCDRCIEDTKKVKSHECGRSSDIRSTEP